MSINVEAIGGTLTVSHYVEEIAEKHHIRLVSISNAFMSTGRSTLHVTWDLKVKAIDTTKCEFTNYVHSQPTKEFLNFLAKQGIPFEQFRQMRQLVIEAHNRQETPFFAASIERAAVAVDAVTTLKKIEKRM
jgi:hypothetical protein